jgi:hypothetical protein
MLQPSNGSFVLSRDYLFAHVKGIFDLLNASLTAGKEILHRNSVNFVQGICRFKNSGKTLDAMCKYGSHASAFCFEEESFWPRMYRGTYREGFNCVVGSRLTGTCEF